MLSWALPVVHAPSVIEIRWFWGNLIKTLNQNRVIHLIYFYSIFCSIHVTNSKVTNYERTYKTWYAYFGPIIENSSISNFYVHSLSVTVLLGTCGTRNGMKPFYGSHRPPTITGFCCFGAHSFQQLFTPPHTLNIIITFEACVTSLV